MPLIGAALVIIIIAWIMKKEKKQCRNCGQFAFRQAKECPYCHVKFPEEGNSYDHFNQ